MSPAVVRSRPRAASWRWRRGCGPVSAGELEEVGSEGGPGGFVGEAGDVVVDGFEIGDAFGSDEVFGGGVEAVGVALDGAVQPGGGVVELAQGRGR